MRAVLAPEVSVAAVEDMLHCMEAVGVVNAGAVKAMTPCVLMPSGSLLPVCESQDAGSRPSGQQRPLRGQKDPVGHVSRDV
jgi:hypothetical protein